MPKGNFWEQMKSWRKGDEWEGEGNVKLVIGLVFEYDVPEVTIF